VARSPRKSLCDFSDVQLELYQHVCRPCEMLPRSVVVASAVTAFPSSSLPFLHFCRRVIVVGLTRGSLLLRFFLELQSADEPITLQGFVSFNPLFGNLVRFLFGKVRGFGSSRSGPGSK